MSGLIPDPPALDPADWRPLVAAHTATGLYGGCVMCPDGTYDWFDLTLADLPPVVDRTGTPTDQVALHARCIPALIEHWGTLTGTDPGAGDSPTAPDVAPGAGVPPTDPFPSRRPRRAPMGVYAQHWGNT
jgi:hypothetical protein